MKRHNKTPMSKTPAIWGQDLFDTQGDDYGSSKVEARSRKEGGGGMFSRTEKESHGEHGDTEKGAVACFFARRMTRTEGTETRRRGWKFEAKSSKGKGITGIYNKPYRFLKWHFISVNILRQALCG